jgi:hypothetical protein
MLDKWYYTKDNQRLGPVSGDDIKQLAASGQLQPGDLVWRQGMTGWTKASEAGIVPSFASTPSSPAAPKPQRQDRLSVFARNAGTWVRVAVSRSKAAARLIAKQAEQARIERLTLRRHYKTLGRHVYTENTFREQFSTAYQRLDGLLCELRQFEAPPVPEEAPDVLAVVKRAGAAAKCKMQTAVMKLKLDRAFAELGRAVCEMCGDQSGPEELVKPLLDGRARLATLAAEMVELAKSEPGQLLTPKRIAIGGVAFVGLVFFWVVVQISGTGHITSIWKAKSVAYEKGYKEGQQDGWKLKKIQVATGRPLVEEEELEREATGWMETIDQTVDLYPYPKGSADCNEYLKGYKAGYKDGLRYTPP